VILIPYGLCLLAVLAGVSYVLLGLWVAVRRGEKCRCPGPERFAVAGYRNPVRWFITQRCGYDLRGHEFNEHDEARCPECGTMVARRRLCRDSMRVRPLATGMLLAVVGACGLRSGWFTLANVAKETPTSALIVVQDVLQTQSPEEVCTELGERIRGTALDQWQTEQSVEVLIRDLRDDDVKENGTKARELLAMLGDDAITGLEKALESDDYQQRQYAAEVLRQHFGYRPNQRMLEVCVEGLGHQDRVAYNAGAGADYLVSHIADAEPLVVRGLGSSDPLRRFLCAAVLACGRRSDHADRVAPMLIAHLADNDIANDAAYARSALEALGAPARPYLERAVNAADRQLRRHAKQLIGTIDAAASRMQAGQPEDAHVPSLGGADRIWFPEFRDES